MRQILFCLTMVLLMLAASAAPGQPKPGDIFREFTFNPGKTAGAHLSELDPNCPRKQDPSFGMRNMKPSLPHKITLDLDHAVRAELSIEYWGGHIGTGGQKFCVNGHAWTDIAQPAGTPTDPVCYQRTLLGNNAVPVPLDQLKQGENVVQFAAGPQVKYSFNWGFYWIYDFTIRVYYDAAKPHPTGRVNLPAAGATLGERLANRFGVMHNFSFNALEVPPAKLKRGDNDVTIYSEFSGHALEINWPGPVLLVEFSK